MPLLRGEVEAGGETGGGFSAPVALADLGSRMGRLLSLSKEAPLGTAVQALHLLFALVRAGVGEGEGNEGVDQGEDGEGDAPRRVYAALYARLRPDSMPERSSKHAMLLTLVYRVVVSDPEPKRARAFLKRLLQTALSAPAPLAAACVFLVARAIAAKPVLAAGVTQPEGRKLGVVMGGGVALEAETVDADEDAMDGPVPMVKGTTEEEKDAGKTDHDEDIK